MKQSGAVELRWTLHHGTHLGELRSRRLRRLLLVVPFGVEHRALLDQLKVPLQFGGQDGPREVEPIGSGGGFRVFLEPWSARGFHYNGAILTEAEIRASE